ncbi:CoA transferase [bacterium]|nr:MAG: CoA transferase [bacterium]MCL4231197.1 CoA transferase [Dehalococcoidia bacterium]
MNGPLSGFTVTEVANYIAAPAAGAILADLGARVIHLEPVDGDPYRGFRLGMSGFRSGEGGDELAFQVDNRGKESIALDLRAPDARDVLHALLGRSDVLVTNLSDSQLAGIGLDPAEIAGRFSGLVFARVNGYGFRGDEATTESFDLGAFWARGGLLEGMAGPEGDLAQPRPGVGDHATAISLVAGIVLSLLQRERTGAAPPVRTSLLDTAMWLNSLDIAGAAFYGQAPEKRRGSLPLLSAYPAADGRRIYLQITHDRAWRGFAHATGHPEWLTDDRFQGFGLRLKNASALRSLVAEALATRPLAEWTPLFREHGVPVAIVNSAADIVSDPQVAAGGHLLVGPGDDGRPLAVVSAPFEVGDSAPAPGSQPPLAPPHGAQSESLLIELGYSWEEVAALRERGILGPA